MTIVIDSVLTNPDNPRICYNNLSAAATVTASSEATGFAKENVQDSQTFNFWKPTSQNSYLEFDMGSPTTINYICIASHNMATNGNTVNIQYWDGLSPGSWVTIDTHTPTDDSVIMFLFADSTHQIFKVEITGGTVPTVGVIYMGNQLVVERRIYGGFTPPTLAKKTVIRPQKSEGGQWVGRSIVREGVQINIKLANLTSAWVHASLKPFINDAISNPFFFAWRPTSYPAEVAYCWTAKDIRASNIGQAGLMQTSFTVDARLE